MRVSGSLPVRIYRPPGSQIITALRAYQLTPSMHVVAKLVDVWPDGTARRMLLSARHVDAADYGRELEIRIGDIGYRVQPGHRIRVEVASSCYPFYELHPGTGEDPWTATSRRAVKVRVLNRPVRVALTTLCGQTPTD